MAFRGNPDYPAESCLRSSRDAQEGTENVSVVVRIVDLLVLPRGAVLKLGTDVELQVTGLRNPCAQTDKFKPDLLEAVLGRGPDGERVRKSGIMTIVVEGGGAPGDAISIAFPMPPLLPLEVL